MCVLGAVFTDTVVVQQLTDYIWTGGNPYCDEELLSVAHLFKALSVSLNHLHMFYGSLATHSAASASHSNNQHIYLLLHSYHVSSDGDEVKF